MWVVGIDQSATSSGICVLSLTGEVGLLTRIRPAETCTATSRLQFLRTELTQILSNYPDVKLAAMEGYSYNSANKKFVLGEIGAIVKLVLADHGIPTLTVAPKQLKKFVTGNGSAEKEAVQEAIALKWNIEISQNDEADAYGLARVALATVLQNSNNRAELEILKNLSTQPLRKSKRRSRLTGLSNAV